MVEVPGRHERVTVTRNGGPVAGVLAVEDSEPLVETLGIVSGPTAMAGIWREESQMRDGEVYGGADVRAALAGSRVRRTRVAARTRPHLDRTPRRR